jgi:hypothetical protein
MNQIPLHSADAPSYSETQMLCDSQTASPHGLTVFQTHFSAAFVGTAELQWHMEQSQTIDMDLTVTKILLNDSSTDGILTLTRSEKRV